MHPLSGGWHYSLGPDPFLDFCVWALERDGLRPPFARHRDLLARTDARRVSNPPLCGTADGCFTSSVDVGF